MFEVEGAVVNPATGLWSVHSDITFLPSLQIGWMLQCDNSPCDVIGNAIPGVGCRVWYTPLNGAEGQLLWESPNREYAWPEYASATLKVFRAYIIANATYVFRGFDAANNLVFTITTPADSSYPLVVSADENLIAYVPTGAPTQFKVFNRQLGTTQTFTVTGATTQVAIVGAAEDFSWFVLHNHEFPSGYLRKVTWAGVVTTLITGNVYGSVTSSMHSRCKYFVSYNPDHSRSNFRMTEDGTWRAVRSDLTSMYINTLDGRYVIGNGPIYDDETGQFVPTPMPSNAPPVAPGSIYQHEVEPIDISLDGNYVWGTFYNTNSGGRCPFVWNRLTNECEAFLGGVETYSDLIVSAVGPNSAIRDFDWWPALVTYVPGEAPAKRWALIYENNFETSLGDDVEFGTGVSPYVIVDNGIRMVDPQSRADRFFVYTKPLPERFRLEMDVVGPYLDYGQTGFYTFISETEMLARNVHVPWAYGVLSHVSSVDFSVKNTDTTAPYTYWFTAAMGAEESWGTYDSFYADLPGTPTPCINVTCAVEVDRVKRTQHSFVLRDSVGEWEECQLVPVFGSDQPYVGFYLHGASRITAFRIYELSADGPADFWMEFDGSQEVG